MMRITHSICKNTPKVLKDMNALGMGFRTLSNSEFATVKHQSDGCHNCVSVKREKLTREKYCVIGHFFVYINTICEKYKRKKEIKK